VFLGQSRLACAQRASRFSQDSNSDSFVRLWGWSRQIIARKCATRSAGVRSMARSDARGEVYLTWSVRLVGAAGAAELVGPSVAE
jgi:hypothetical protein